MTTPESIRLRVAARYLTGRQLLDKHRVTVPTPASQAEVATDADVTTVAEALRRVAARMRTDPDRRWGFVARILEREALLAEMPATRRHGTGLALDVARAYIGQETTP